MKGIVIYKGKYGATAQYATWLAEALYLPMVDIEKQSVADLKGYDYVVIGSPVYIGNLLIRDWLRKNVALLQQKKIFLFVVCATANGSREKQATILKENLPVALLENVEFFFLPGRVVVKKLSWLDRLILRAGAFMESDPAKKQLMLRGFDSVKREHINRLIKLALHYSNSEILS